MLHDVVYDCISLYHWGALIATPKQPASLSSFPLENLLRCRDTKHKRINPALHMITSSFRFGVRVASRVSSSIRAFSDNRDSRVMLTHKRGMDIIQDPDLNKVRAA